MWGMYTAAHTVRYRYTRDSASLYLFMIVYRAYLLMGFFSASNRLICMISWVFVKDDPNFGETSCRKTAM